MNGGWLRGTTGVPDESTIGERYIAEKHIGVVEPIIEIQPIDVSRNMGNA